LGSKYLLRPLVLRAAGNVFLLKQNWQHPARCWLKEWQTLSTSWHASGSHCEKGVGSWGLPISIA